MIETAGAGTALTGEEELCGGVPVACARDRAELGTGLVPSVAATALKNNVDRRRRRAGSPSGASAFVLALAPP